MKSVRRSIAMGSTLALGLLTTSLAQPSGAAASVGCGQVITQNTTLADDVGPCTGDGDGIIIGADGITLNLAGHRVFRTGGPADNVGIHLMGRSGVVVKGGTVTGFGTGVAIQAGSDNTVWQMNIHDNVGLLDGSGNFGDGVGIFNSSRNVVADSRVVRNGPFEGVGVFGNGRRLDRNTTVDNVIQNNLIESNDILRTDAGAPEPITLDDGINLGQALNGGSHTSILNNVIRRNGLNGIDACSIRGNPCFTDHNVIDNNKVQFNGFTNLSTNGEVGDGIRIVTILDRPGGDSVIFPTSNVVTNNLIQGNASTGLFLATARNQILNNRVVGNGASHTFDVDNVDFLLANNISIFDGRCPFFLSHNVIQSNTFGTISPYQPGLLECLRDNNVILNPPPPPGASPAAQAQGASGRPSGTAQAISPRRAP